MTEKKRSARHHGTERKTIVFYFSWDDCNTQEKLETMVMQNLGGGGGVNKTHALWSM